MFSDQEAEVSLNVPAKCIASVEGDRTESRFLVGTCSSSADQENHLHVLRFHSELNEFGIDGILSLPEGVGSLCTCPTDKSLVLTSGDCTNDVTLYKIPDEIIEKNDELEYKPQEEMGGTTAATTSASSDDGMMMAAQNNPESSSLTNLASLHCSARLSQILWRSDEDEDGIGGRFDDDYNLSSTSASSDVLTLDWEGQILKWDSNDGEPRIMRTETIFGSNDGVSSPTVITPPRMAADPHNVNAICVTANENIHILDWRVDTSSLPSGTVSQMKGCHRYGVTDVDYNPNKPYVLATSGQDSLIKFWDLRYHNNNSTTPRRRKPQPLLVGRGGHSHWVSNIKYNPFHDQLVVSTGTDSVVNLWRVSSISSAPLLQLDDENDDLDGSAGDIMFQSSDGDDIPNITKESSANGGGGNIGGSSAANIRVSRYEHQDSVYDMAWGAADAWIYVTVAYDGKVVLNHVPSNEKYKILL